MILYQGRPTTTIAVGDPLTFKLESMDGTGYATDMFATNVVARDPYSGRSVQLIDRFGLVCFIFFFFMRLFSWHVIFDITSNRFIDGLSEQSFR